MSEHENTGEPLSPLEEFDHFFEGMKKGSPEAQAAKDLMREVSLEYAGQLLVEEAKSPPTGQDVWNITAKASELGALRNDIANRQDDDRYRDARKKLNQLGTNVLKQAKTTRPASNIDVNFATTVAPLIDSHLQKLPSPAAPQQ